MASKRVSSFSEPFQTFGEWLRSIREAQQLPLRAVAAAAEMDQAHLCKVELGQRLLTSRQTDAIALFFHIDRDEMEARQIVERFRTDYSQSPAAKTAILMLHERVETYGTEK